MIRTRRFTGRAGRRRCGTFLFLQRLPDAVARPRQVSRLPHWFAARHTLLGTRNEDARGRFSDSQPVGRIRSWLDDPCVPRFTT